MVTIPIAAATSNSIKVNPLVDDLESKEVWHNESIFLPFLAEDCWEKIITLQLNDGVNLDDLENIEIAVCSAFSSFSD